jgi:hypothetical protein
MSFMFPTDSEFLILYFFYLLIGFVLIFGTFFSIKYKSFSKINLVVFFVYTVLFGLLYSDKSNFEGGSSLVVLFYSGMFIFLHVLFLIIFGIYKTFFIKNN